MAGTASLFQRDAFQAAQSAAATRGAFSAQVLPAGEAALRAYRAFCAGSVHSPTQSPLWAEAWLSGSGRDGLVILLARDGRPAMALAVEIVRKGPFRIARFAGGTHANGNFPALHPESGALGREAMDAVVAAVRSARPDLDMLALERQRMSFEGLPNPTLCLPHAVSANVSLAVDLAGGFDDLLTRNGKRKRKKHRSQIRSFEEAGGYRHIEARTPDEADLMLERFFALKHERFLSLGLPDVFADPGVRASFRSLFRKALGEERPAFVLHGLEVGGKLRAVTGSSRTRDSIICEFSAFALDELAASSPGDFLFYENIAAACAEGLAVYDFSVGDEPYKRLWCDIETTHADVFIGLTGRARPVAALLPALSRLKRATKRNATALRLARRLKRLVSRSG